MTAANRTPGAAGGPPSSYAEAGVSIEAGNALVRAIAPLVKATARPGAEAVIGGFGGLFDLKAAGFADPILVAATDGVGTKLKLAAQTGRHEGIGQDLVAMCVNDLIVQGAEPLFFLDYFATGRLDPAVAHTVVAGIARACKIAGCALIGGETAEMPGHYAPGDYDLAGFAVGAAERGRILDGSRVRPGDHLLGLASSGAHSNGYSLVRRLIEGVDLDQPASFGAGATLADVLMEPTRLYVAPLLPLLADGRITALAHVTGGGLLENVPRVLPDGCRAEIDAGCWTVPPLFDWLREQGGIAPDEMLRTFNCGVGMVAIVRPEAAEDVQSSLGAAGQRVVPIGQVAEGPRGITIRVPEGVLGAGRAMLAEHCA